MSSYTVSTQDGMKIYGTLESYLNDVIQIGDTTVIEYDDEDGHHTETYKVTGKEYCKIWLDKVEE